MSIGRLSENAQKLLAILKNIVPPHTYLAGGSGLAIHLDHRDSYDLDLYSPLEYNYDQVAPRFDQVIPEYKQIESGWQTIHGVSGDTELSLFCYQYPLLVEPIEVLGFPVASVEDIGAMKIEAISSRGLKRDFFDVFSICLIWQVSLFDVLGWYRSKYPNREQVMPHILKVLLYFDDAETKPERAKIVDEEWENVKKFFQVEVPKVQRGYLEGVR
jgi:hypothetical protein